MRRRQEPHDFCTLVGYGADGICPYGAYAAVAAFSAGPAKSEEEALATYRRAGEGDAQGDVEDWDLDGPSYKGAQIFEAIHSATR